MLCGFYPFEGDDAEETFKLIENIDYDFEDEIFDKISSEAKDLISMILTPERDRLTLEQVLEHDWITNNSKIEDSNEISSFLRNRLKNFTKCTLLKKAVCTLIATQVSDKNIKECTKAFNKININQDGRITLEELERGMA